MESSRVFKESSLMSILMSFSTASTLSRFGIKQMALILLKQKASERYTMMELQQSTITVSPLRKAKSLDFLVQTVQAKAPCLML